MKKLKVVDAVDCLGGLPLLDGEVVDICYPDGTVDRKTVNVDVRRKGHHGHTKHHLAWVQIDYKGTKSRYYLRFKPTICLQRV